MSYMDFFDPEVAFLFFCAVIVAAWIWRSV
jgi:hypothetical protein